MRPRSFQTLDLCFGRSRTRRRGPDLTGLSPWVLNEELRNLEISTGSLFNFSFFITQNMKTQLRNGPVYGALPVLYVFLARTGKTIHQVTR